MNTLCHQRTFQMVNGLLNLSKRAQNGTYGDRKMAVLFGFALFLFVPGIWAQVAVSNIVVTQRPGTKLADIAYDVSSTGMYVAVSVVVSDAGIQVSATNLSGDVGCVVPTGTGKNIVWNMGTDWDGNYALLQFLYFNNNNINLDRS